MKQILSIYLVKVTVILSSFLASSFVYAENPLVSVVDVTGWEKGASHTLYCQVQTANTYQLSSHSSARLNWVLPEGSLVKKGQLIASQDEYYLKNQINRLQLDVQSASAQEEFTAMELERLSSLNKQLVSSSALHDIARQSKQALLNKKMLQQELEEATYRLKMLKHYAPVNGQILAMQAQLGENLDAGQNVIQIQPSDDKELACEISLGKYRQANQLIDANFLFANAIALKLDRQSISLNASSQTLKLFLQPVNRDQALMLIGERIPVSVSSKMPKLTRIPHDALEVGDDGYYTWRLTSDDKVNRIKIDIISSQENHFIVKSELIHGDKVVTFGKQGLTDSQQVEVNRQPLNEGA